MECRARKVARAGPMEMSSSDDDQDQSDGSVNAWGSDDPNIDTAENKRLSRAENENIIKELQRKLIEIGHEKLSDASVARICKHVQREIRAKYDAPSGAWAGPGSLSRTGPLLDPQLKATIANAFQKYVGVEANLCLDNLCKDISDILYDEMCYHDVAKRLTESYEKEISELQGTKQSVQQQMAQLLHQHGLDLAKLKDERRKRLSFGLWRCRL